MVKRIISAFLVLVFSFNMLFLSSCAKEPSEEDDNFTKDENEETKEENEEKEGNEDLILTNLSKMYTECDLSEEKLREALAVALSKIDVLLADVGEDFPNETSKENIYGKRENTGGWTTGFFTGMLWHSYEITGDEKYKSAASDRIDSFEYIIDNKIGVNHHDMGFLYTLSCVSAYKITADERAKNVAIKAADHLITRYREKGSFIQAWGSIEENSSNYRLIIDTLMNLPLLYFASEVTGDESYREVARAHYDTAASLVYRDDGSTYHTYFFNQNTGEPTKGVTRQGLSDESTWSRGQAWGIYGPLLTYVYEQNEDALTIFKEATNYFLLNLPSDYVPYWDFTYGDGSEEPRDSSAAAIALCGILEGIKYMEDNDPLKEIYVSAAKKIMNSLIDNYATTEGDLTNGLLLHGTQNMPDGTGVDEMSMWGDYFYLEALHRMLDEDWQLYW